MQKKQYQSGLKMLNVGAFDLIWFPQLQKLFWNYICVMSQRGSEKR